MLFPAVYFLMDDFLLPEEMSLIWSYIINRETEFQVTRVSPPSGPMSVNEEYRRSRVLMDLGPYRTFLALRLRSYLPSVLRHLRHRPFEVSHLDLQITATNDGEFFRTHSDSGVAPYHTRQITFVHYFFRHPKRFTGGDLTLYDTRIDGFQRFADGASLTVAPRHNQVLFFPSRLLHEVHAVRCPSRGFRHSRFTLNGWFHSRQRFVTNSGANDEWSV
jgi:Rps23 Pro-64 3,4-dihydroxylase Tpa1-like proline 4-hydroxylase